MPAGRIVRDWGAGLPRVSVLIAMRNESRHIRETLECVLAQDYPQELLEVIVADGQSTDDSCAIVESIIANHSNCRLIENPERIQSCGWNLGITQCSGDVITILSAHCEVAVDYVATAVETLRRTGAAMVGGPMCACSSGPIGTAIALGTSSPFGVGGAKFHYATEEIDVDTVYQGFCWRELYEVLGGFDTDMVRNQDDELSFRIKAAGGRIVCNPAIKSRYHNRATYATLYRQYSQYGFWKVRLMQKCASQMRFRHFVPAAFVLALIGLPWLAILEMRFMMSWLVLLAAYGTGVSSATRRVAAGQPSAVFWRVPLVFPILHLGYGIGFLKGLMYWPWHGKPGLPPLLLTASNDS